MNILETRVNNFCENGNLKGLQKLLLNNPNILIANETTFRLVCIHRHLRIAKWLLEVNPDINISANNNQVFQWACFIRELKMAQWLQSLKPNLYIIEYNKDGSYKSHYIRTMEEKRWEQRKCALWLASNESPRKECLFYRIPEDVSRYIISNYL